MRTLYGIINLSDKRVSLSIVTCYLLLIMCLMSAQTTPTNKAFTWKLPTMESHDRAREQCRGLEQQEGYIRCIMSELLLLDDITGYDAQKIAKIFVKQNVPTELITVIEYCNESQHDTNTAKWADGAYKCVTVGRIGQWVDDYLKHIYAKKTLA